MLWMGHNAANHNSAQFAKLFCFHRGASARNTNLTSSCLEVSNSNGQIAALTTRPVLACNKPLLQVSHLRYVYDTLERWKNYTESSQHIALRCQLVHWSK